MAGEALTGVILMMGQGRPENKEMGFSLLSQLKAVLKHIEN